MKIATETKVRRTALLCLTLTSVAFTLNVRDYATYDGLASVPSPKISAVLRGFRLL